MVTGPPGCCRECGLVKNALERASSSHISAINWWNFSAYVPRPWAPCLEVCSRGLSRAGFCSSMELCIGRGQHVRLPFELSLSLLLSPAPVGLCVSSSSDCSSCRQAENYCIASPSSFASPSVDEFMVSDSGDG